MYILAFKDLNGKEIACCFTLFVLMFCLVIVVRLFLMMPRVCLQFVSVVFTDHTHLLLWERFYKLYYMIHTCNCKLRMCPIVASHIRLTAFSVLLGR